MTALARSIDLQIVPALSDVRSDQTNYTESLYYACKGKRDCIQGILRYITIEPGSEDRSQLRSLRVEPGSSKVNEIIYEIIFTRDISVPLVVYNAYIIVQDILVVVYFVVFDISLVRAPALSVHMASDVRRLVVAHQFLDIFWGGMGLRPMFGAEVPLIVASTFPVFVVRAV